MLSLPIVAALASAFVTAGNLIVAHSAVEHVSAATLSFWRCLIGAVCVLPLAFAEWRELAQQLRNDRRRVLPLSFVGMVLPPLFMYTAVDTGELIDVGVGVTTGPLLAAVFSFLLLRERLRPLQIVGLLLGCIGALVFAFKGSLDKVLAFHPHADLPLAMACSGSINLYLVLSRMFAIRTVSLPWVGVLLSVAAVLLAPALFDDLRSGGLSPLLYNRKLWAAILYVGAGMGLVRMFLVTYSSARIGPTTTTLFNYAVPIIVAMHAVVVLGHTLHVYQVVGAALIGCGGLLVIYGKAK